jgi:glutamate-5-semialdehyde dehydrogenase
MATNLIEKQFNKLKSSQRLLAASSDPMRRHMLTALAQHLENSINRIEETNRKDLDQAEKDGLAEALIHRLQLNEQKIRGVCEGVRQVAGLPDPIGQVRERRLLDRDLLLERISAPIGVIGMIFESRPDALIQMLSLALKSGNGLVLKGGSEALHTNRLLVELAREAFEPFAAGSGWMVHLEKREDVSLLLELDTLVDLIIPRGSNAFVRYVMDNTRIPVLGHADGLCSIYVDLDADLNSAVRVVTDAKCQYPAACNAVETVLVHRAIAPFFLPLLEESLRPFQVRIHGDRGTSSLIDCAPATESSWSSEYLDYELSIKLVDSVDEAIAHIGRYGSGHTDAILTQTASVARHFMREVDSADVFWNCSTRFADGFRFGLGAEVGISTQKIHARGPVGLDGLVTDKWLLEGKGQLVGSYETGQAHFSHQSLDLDGPSILDGGDR